MTLILIDSAFMTTYLVMDKLPLRKTKWKRHSGKYDGRYLVISVVSVISDFGRSYGLYPCVSSYGGVFNTFHAITRVWDVNITVHLSLLS